MFGKTVRNTTIAFVVAVLSVGLLVQNATACDRDKLTRLAQGASMAALAQSGARHGMSAVRSAAPLSGTINMVGLWDVKDYAGGSLIDEYFDTWHSDGNELFIDATNPIEDNVCQGIWKQVSLNSFKLKHVSWYFDNTGTLQGWAIFHDYVQMASDGNSFTGTENVYVYDLNGNLVAEYDGDTLTATRITVDF